VIRFEPSRRWFTEVDSPFSSAGRAVGFRRGLGPEISKRRRSIWGSGAWFRVVFVLADFFCEFLGGEYYFGVSTLFRFRGRFVRLISSVSYAAPLFPNDTAPTCFVADVSEYFGSESPKISALALSLFSPG
jgi:hypothetical protein